jgi:hypothetical protein
LNIKAKSSCWVFVTFGGKITKIIYCTEVPVNSGNETLKKKFASKEKQFHINTVISAGIANILTICS